MRRMITALAVCAALLVAGAPVPAEAEDAVRVLKAVLGPGRGVHFTETATVLDNAGERAGHRRSGVLETGEKGGVKALDVTVTGGEHGRERSIGFNHDVGGTAYRSGGLAATLLPERWTWWKNAHQFHLFHTELFGHDQQLVNPAEPATLAALLKNGQVSGNTVTGSITFDELEEVSAWAQHASPGWKTGTALSYTLTLTPAGLVSRVRSTYQADGSPAVRDVLGDLAGRTVRVDTRYSRWGDRVSIEPPDPRATTTELCAEPICRLRLPG
ncbi:hypothetical protein HD597_002783 [Nonomuraea thailandensis]|uniref:Lipoprotein n=1 Tax=Nonomuraea thailandensis TaxID=1188745 RepID=A0A9X2K0B6_9ACTN|nr:hypothetical protein [Nonomuraea thailandensis]MCP2355763.1 hypothetical protein [Nonomuraea thailandensis]